MNNTVNPLPDAVVQAIAEFARIVANLRLKPPPPPPNALKASTGTSAGKIDLVWTVNAENEEGFDIERKGATDTEFKNVKQIHKPNVTTFADTGLTCGSTYSYRVRAFNTNGPSPYSNIADAAAI